MRKKFKFNPMFGLKLRDRLDGTFYSILILVVLLFSAAPWVLFSGIWSAESAIR